eukprot:TRINITY_DN4285_c0_g1_i2.p1 TRINITY_DN4285_c0_g1~~TRINITY_DN4285_c0_g1_i2.p1  ORF type:complete len:688 (+),score=129.66 TRINITY_DN4285_c0_g1_i2:356-2419(+)
MHVNLLPTVSDEHRFKLEQHVQRHDAITQPILSPCGGFTTTYTSLCEYYDVVPRSEILWDMDFVLPANRVLEFQLKELDHPVSAQELKPYLEALNFNSYFKTFSCRNMKLEKETLMSIADIFKTNSSLTTLVLSGVGATRDFFIQFATNAISNKNIALTKIDFSNNPIDSTQAMKTLSSYLESTPCELSSLDFSHCGINSKSLASFFTQLISNPKLVETLTHLDFSYNSVENASSALSLFLAKPTHLKKLILSGAGVDLDTILLSLDRGCPHLETLDLSYNKFPRETISMEKFLQFSSSYNDLQFSNCNLLPETVRVLIRSINTNKKISNVALNISGNSLELLGANLLSFLLRDFTNITSLDVSDNNFSDEGMAYFAEGLLLNTTLKELKMGKNFSRGSQKPEERKQAVELISKVIRCSSIPLESIKLEGGKDKLETDIIPIINALGSNSRLTHLDISNHSFGDRGALALSRALQINRSLKNLLWDSNGVSAEALNFVREGASRSDSLQIMQLPWVDMSRLNDKEKLGEFFLGVCNSKHNMYNSTPKTSAHLEDFLPEKFRSNKKMTPEQVAILTDVEHHDAIVTGLNELKGETLREFQGRVETEMKGLSAELAPIIDDFQRKAVRELLDKAEVHFSAVPDRGEVGTNLESIIKSDCKDISSGILSRIMNEQVGEEIVNEVTRTRRQ